VHDGAAQAMLTDHTNEVTSCAFSPDGTLLATTSSGRTARLWNVHDGTIHAVLADHSGWVEDCGFPPDGTLVATVGHDQTVRLWQVPTGRRHCTLRVASDLNGIAWHPDATLLYAAGGAGAHAVPGVSSPC
jgi:WD40 repeat protein